jgi:hypothetical protein
MFCTLGEPLTAFFIFFQLVIAIDSDLNHIPNPVTSHHRTFAEQNGTTKGCLDNENLFTRKKFIHALHWKFGVSDPNPSSQQRFGKVNRANGRVLPDFGAEDDLAIPIDPVWFVKS